MSQKVLVIKSAEKRNQQESFTGLERMSRTIVPPLVEVIQSVLQRSVYGVVVLTVGDPDVCVEMVQWFMQQDLGRRYRGRLIVLPNVTKWWEREDIETDFVVLHDLKAPVVKKIEEILEK